MTIEELYEKMRVDAEKNSNIWDDLDYASGFDDDVMNCDGEFLQWALLSDSQRVTFTEKLAPWLAREA